jgi:hypothetical protein
MGRHMGWDAKARKEVLRAIRWFFGRLDTLAALVGGTTAAVLAWAGHLNSEELGTAILTLLSVVAFSMVVERSLRLKASEGIDEARADLAKTRETLRAIEVGSPYYVTESDCFWEIDEAGGCTSCRRKHLRFTQDEVVTVLDWMKVDGKPQSIKYRPEPGKRVHKYISDGRTHYLVALDRPYGREEELDFFIDRRVEGCFVTTPERVVVVAYEPTSLVKMTVRWPKGRPPKAVRFFRRTDAERQKPVAQTVKHKKGQAEVTVIAQNPEPGERLAIEWDWDLPAAPPTAGDQQNGVPASKPMIDPGS